MIDYKKMKEKHRKNSVGCRSDCHYIANTRMLSRILLVLHEMGEANITQLGEGICTNGQRVKDALNWLVNNKLVCQDSYKPGFKRDYNIYYLNPMWENLKYDQM